MGMPVITASATTRDQAITDLIQSVALEETALSHILNAEGEKIQKFWHTHCDFCTEKITTEDSRICYCTLDYSTWICKNCFDDFCKKFDFKLQPTRNN